MSGADGATKDAPISNYECVRGPRELTRDEVEMARTEDGDAATQPFFAIKREDGYVGHDIGSNSPSPKIRVLYVTADGRRSFTRMHDAEEVEDGDADHAFVGGFPAVLQRTEGAGFQTARKSIAGFRDLVEELHQVDP
ncbi:hypothetical protein [Halobacterium sp. CBA1126]|uniref:hypothetical protein n=1 Tax=Halobacterium sp. CBA1126 TaxID=2668074 RepID=UPI0012FB630A|nr:hypothetical protein [Halobacterium sp. CBA1126]MUV59799.1 hypothetical protein [Halobacterium sp. CBA1126]